tara:strand:- start:293 stop:958 length:666 start_codon:yes stop_codon:yes gene_type:complete
MTENLAIWDRFADIDPDFTKDITGKDYKGTSPNAHYITKCLTELFGPVGIGFGWRVLAESVDHFGDTAIHWCRIEFWHTDRANVFESYGQTKMAYMTRGASGYLKVDEDAPKKSLTDAITKAAAQVGIAANIFLGRWDDNKYVEAVKAEFKEAAKPKFDADACETRLRAGMAKLKTKQERAKWWEDEKPAIGSLKDADAAAYAKLREDLGALVLVDADAGE